MRDKTWKVDLRRQLGQAPPTRRMDETVGLCRQLVRSQAAREEARLGFWGFLSDILRLEATSLLLSQAGVLLLVCLAACSSAGDACQIPTYMPLFMLAAMPVLFRGQYYRTSELEAATRASGPQIALARLILSGAATLICVTVLLGLEISLQGSWKALGQMVLYCLVPYLTSMTAALFLIRKKRTDGFPVCIVITAGSVAFWIGSAKLLPRLYEASAVGVWVVAFLAFSCLYAREIVYIIRANKEGRMYGIVD